MAFCKQGSRWVSEAHSSVLRVGPPGVGHPTGAYTDQNQEKVGLSVYLNPQRTDSQFTQSCPTPCNPMNRSMLGLPVHHQLLEFTHTHVHRVGDAIQSSHSLSSPSPPALNPSQHQGLFQWVNSSHEVAKVLEFQLQHQSFQWIPRTDLL